MFIVKMCINQERSTCWCIEPKWMVCFNVCFIHGSWLHSAAPFEVWC